MKKNNYNNSLDNNIDNEEIKKLYNYIINKQKQGIPLNKIFLNSNEDNNKIDSRENFSNDEIFYIITCLIKKPNKTPEEQYIIKSYLYILDKFINIFKDLKFSLDDLMDKIANSLKIEYFVSNSLICREGDKGDKVYIILKGSISILILKKKLAKMNKKNYLKFLLLLILFQEFSLLNKIITINKDKFYIEEKEIICLFYFFKLYKLLIKYEIMNINQEKYIQRFFEENSNKVIIEKIYKKTSYDIESALNILNLKEEAIQNIYNFFDKIVDDINNEYMNENIKNEKNIILPKNNKIDFLINSNIIPNSIINNISIEKYISRINPFNYFFDIDINSNNNNNINNPEDDNLYKEITLYIYTQVVTLSDGNIFGEVALLNSSQKRTASIISITPVYLGILTKNVYTNYLKTTQDKIRSNNIQFFLKNPLFKGISQIIFESKYLNMFKNLELKKNKTLFEKNSIRNSIFFIKKGECEIEISCSFKEMDKILNYLKNKKEEDEEDFLEKTKKDKKLFRYLKDNKNFYNYYFNEKHSFKFCYLKDNEIIGIDDFILYDNKYYCECKVISNNLIYFELTENFFENLKKELIINKNIKDFKNLKQNMLYKKLLNIKNTLIGKEINKINIEDNEQNQIIEKNKFKLLKSKLVLPIMEKQIINKDIIKQIYNNEENKNLKKKKSNFFNINYDYDKIKTNNLRYFSPDNNNKYNSVYFNDNNKNNLLSFSNHKKNYSSYLNSTRKTNSNINNEKDLLKHSSIFIPNIRKKQFLIKSNPLKIMEKKYQSNRVLNTEQNFYYKNFNIFKNIINNNKNNIESNKNNKNNNNIIRLKLNIPFIDILSLDNWAKNIIEKKKINTSNIN